VVCSYLNNLEQRQKATHAIRELIRKLPSSMIAILNRQGLEAVTGVKIHLPNSLFAVIVLLATDSAMDKSHASHCSSLFTALEISVKSSATGYRIPTIPSFHLMVSSESFPRLIVIRVTAPTLPFLSLIRSPISGVSPLA